MMTSATTPAARPTGADDHSASPTVVRQDSNMRRSARIVGVLFLAGYVAYGVGSLIAQGIVDSDDRGDSTALFATGVALMLLNSAFVIGIGVLMLPILRAHNKRVAAGYLGTRIFEGVGLAVGVVSLIVVTGSSDAIDANALFYSVGEAGLGIGSLFFCALLFRTGLVPRFLAAWGFIGYAFFAVGNLVELAGVAGAGVVGAIPGGLFEITFGIWLIVRGFASTATVGSDRSTD
jgi:MFS family permease